jgi:hypothetical protein
MPKHELRRLGRRMAQLEERLMRWSSSVPASAGCRPPRTCRCRPRRDVVERDAIPGGRAGMIFEQGFRLDNGPTVLTMPNLSRTRSTRPGRDEGLRHDQPGRPDVPGRLRRRLHAVRAPRPRGDDRGDPRVLGRQGRRGVRPVLHVARAALPRRDGFVHRRQLRHPARPDQALEVRPRTRQAGRFRQARQEGGVVLRRRAPAAHLQLPVDVRRPRAVRGARAVRRDHLHGLRRGRVRPRGWHAHDGRRPGRRSHRRRRRDPLLVAGHPHPAQATAAPSPVSRSAAPNGSTPTPWCATSTSPSPTDELLPGIDAPAHRPKGQVLAVVPAVGRRREGPAARPTPATTTSTSARTGTARSRP